MTSGIQAYMNETTQSSTEVFDCKAVLHIQHCFFGPFSDHWDFGHIKQVFLA